MANTSVIFENTTTHNSDVTNKYINNIKTNIKWTIVVYSVFSLITLILAITGTKIAWIAFGILVVCLFLITLTNYKGLKRSKLSLSKFEGAVYKYTFYETHFDIIYEFNNKADSDSIKYTQIKQVIRNNGLLAFNLPDQTLLFIDETTINNHGQYKIILDIISKNCQETLKIKRKKK